MDKHIKPLVVERALLRVKEAETREPAERKALDKQIRELNRQIELLRKNKER